MDAVTLTAIAKLLEKQAKTARKGLPAGEYTLDTTVTLHVEGVLDVDENTEYTPTVQIPWKTAFALFLHYSGITRERAMQTLVLAMKEALKTDENAQELLQGLTDLEAAETLVQEGLDELPKQPRAGAVRTGHVVLTELTGKKRAA